MAEIFNMNPGDMIRRDRWGRPLINPVGGGKAEPYTRVSTLSKALDDTSNLMAWKARMTLLGAAKRPDLIALAQSTDDRKTLNDAVEQALSAANSQKAANTGTALHSFAEQLDLGQITYEEVPEPYKPHMAAYQRLLVDAGITVLACEQFIVQDELRAAGSFDRLVTYDGEVMIADIKTGSNVKFMAVATAMQVATYANGKLYDIEEGVRNDLPVSRERGLLIHLPQDAPEEGAVYELDLTEGFRLARLALDVRNGRKAKVIKKIEG